MKIAITGASGFLGRHVLAAIARWRAGASQDTEIVATARQIRGELPHHPAVRWMPLDLAVPPEDPFTWLGRPDVLVHLAWEGLPNYQSPRHLSEELPRQRRFLEAVAGGGRPAMLVAGTCSEYGMQQGCLAEEIPARPAHPYAAAKDALRRHLEGVAATEGCPMTWMRIFYLYGAGQPERALYAQLMRAIARGDAAFAMSAGEQVRDYVPVPWAAAALASLALRLARGCPGDGIVNLASGQPRTVRSLVEQWAREAGSPIRLKLGVFPYPAYEPMAFWGDASKLRGLLGSGSSTWGGTTRRVA